MSDTPCIHDAFAPALQADLFRLARAVQGAGGTLFCVGGAVRDALLGLRPDELDLEVFGLAPERLKAVLAQDFIPLEVGKSFGVFKLKGRPIDVALPRRERKQGSGHRGFDIESDPGLSPAQAAARRDFTLNALLWEPLERRLLDPWGGLDDLRHRRLRHTSAAFSEDPLRVLRGMQFCARFELDAAPETLALCRTMGLEGLAAERQWEEWKKLLLYGREPSRGLEFLRAAGWLRHYPPLQALIGCPQDPSWHPEGDVWQHTLHCLDAFAGRRIGDPDEDLCVGWAVLCHDLGKPATTYWDSGRWRSPLHDQLGEGPTRALLGGLTAQHRLVDAVVTLVLAHLRPHMLWKAGASDQALRRLARDAGRLDRLARVVEADVAGRPPRLGAEDPVPGWLRQRAADLEIQRTAPQPLIQGRDLIALGYPPSSRFGPWLHQIFEAQLEGAFTTVEEGRRYADDYLKASGSGSPSAPRS